MWPDSILLFIFGLVFSYILIRYANDNSDKHGE